jgi:hypothetical protein
MAGMIDRSYRPSAKAGVYFSGRSPGNSSNQSGGGVANSLPDPYRRFKDGRDTQAPQGPAIGSNNPRPYQPTPQPSPRPIERMQPRQEDLTITDYRGAFREMPALPPRESVGRVGNMTMTDRTAAEDAAYGRARDQVGDEARGALTSLSDEMSARGLGGAGLEGALTGGILQKGQGQLGEVNREQAIDRMKRADEIQSQNYQGDLLQRAANLSANVGQRGQDIGNNQSSVSNAMRLMELLRRTRYDSVPSGEGGATGGYPYGTYF